MCQGKGTVSSDSSGEDWRPLPRSKGVARKKQGYSTCLSTCAKWGEKAEGEACCHYVCLDHGLGFSSLHRSLPAHTQPSVEVTHSETQGLSVTLNIILNINNHLNNFKVWKTKYVMKTLLLLVLLLLLRLRHIWKVREYTGDKTASA